jgi:hypothetical protein
LSIGRYGGVLHREAIMASRRTITQQRFRLRDDLLGKLRRAAKANDRSLNDEVELRLMDSFTEGAVAARFVQELRALQEDFNKQIERLNKQIERLRSASDKQTSEG